MKSLSRQFEVSRPDVSMSIHPKQAILSERQYEHLLWITTSCCLKNDSSSMQQYFQLQLMRRPGNTKNSPKKIYLNFDNCKMNFTVVKGT